MGKRILSLLLLLLAAPAHAQNRYEITEFRSIEIVTTGASTAGINISGTWSGTISFKVANGRDTTPVTVDCATPAAPGSAVNTTTGNGAWTCPVAGFSRLVVGFDAYTSGTAIIDVVTAAAPGQTVAAAGGGGSFDGVLVDAAGGDALTDTANNALRVNIVAGAGSGGTAITDDAAFTAATTSVTPAGAVFDDVSPDSVNEGDAGAVRMSANRNLFSTIRDAAGNERGANVNASNQLSVSVDNTVTVAAHNVTNAGTFATQAAQSGTWNITNVSGTVSLPTGAATSANQSTANTALQLIDNPIGSSTGGSAGTASNLAGGIYNSSAPTLTNGQQAALQLSSSGALIVTGAAGTTQYAEDAAHSSGDQTVVLGAIRRDTTPSSSSGTAGDYSAVNVDANGRLYTQAVLYNSSGSELTLANDVVEDAAETAGGSGPMVLSVRRDTAASSAGTTGDNATFNTDSLGRLWVRPGSPCQDHARVQSAAIDTSTSGNVQIVALNGSDLIYICGYSVVVGATATAVQFIYGTGTACATGETDLTGPWPFAANGGITQANGGAPQFVVPAGNAFCVELSAANAITGHVTYVRTAAP